MFFSKREAARIDEPEISQRQINIPTTVLEVKLESKLKQFVKVEISIEDVEEFTAIQSLRSKTEMKGKEGICFGVIVKDEQCHLTLEGKRNFSAAVLLRLVVPNSMLIAFTGKLINGHLSVVGNGQYMNSVKVIGQDVKVDIEELLADYTECMLGDGKIEITNSIIKKIDLVANQGAKIVNADTNKMKILSIRGVSISNLLVKDTISIVTVSGKVKADVCFPDTCKGQAVIKTVTGKITGTIADYYKATLETVNAGIDVQLKPLDRKTTTKLDSYGFEGGYQVHTRHHDAAIDNGENVDLIQEKNNIDIYEPQQNIYISEDGAEQEVPDEKPNGPPTVEKIEFSHDESMVFAEGSKVNISFLE
ncbi:hypothetical protein HK103_004842 [Boothiomyces macroporosus]|uniref:Adhesin domain-containing protein n=1 Tax=Boothiomyces macroporosus TaxID=261099 RepID=A0AAD5UGC5_9FUNG|nr:hypothetical protein HK103_004842 [Boothiomyces macroporosus]